MQIEHIRKMKTGLPAASDVEEDTMDGELGGLPPTAGDDTTDDTTGGLAAYGDADVKAAMAVETKLANEREKYYDKIAKALAEKRYAPSFSERMYQLSAAFAAPTSVRGFSGVMGNVMPVLAAQEKAKREGEISRREALEQLETNRLTNRLGLAKQDTQTKIALARLARQGVGSSVTYADSRKGYLPKPGVGGNAPMPEVNQYGYYVISDPRQLIYLPPNTPVVYPGGDQTKPKYTPANPTG